jgi:putative transposase
VLAKVPAEAQTEIRDAYWAIFDTEDLIAAGLQPGPTLVAAVQHRIDAFAGQYARAFPAAVKCLLSDREQLTSYLRFPLEHHRRIRHSNFIWVNRPGAGATRRGGRKVRRPTVIWVHPEPGHACGSGDDGGGEADRWVASA